MFIRLIEIYKFMPRSVQVPTESYVYLLLIFDASIFVLIEVTSSRLTL